MTIILREYQQDCITNVRQALRSVRNVLLQAPTGAGKTAMATAMLGNVQAKGNRGFFICHRQELVEQTALTFDKAGIDYGFIASGKKPNFFKPIQICSIDTLKNRLHIVPSPHVCIWDEAHHMRAAGWTRTHDYFIDSFHIGLSATPQRLDGKGLDDRFDFLVPGPSVAWLIDQGYLAKYKLFSVPHVDRKQFHSRMGDFVNKEVVSAMDKPAITGDIVGHWKKCASNKLTIGFAASRKMSEKYVEAFNAAGIPAMHLDGETPKAERRQALKAFARGEYRVVWNVGLFGEGFDIAANSGMDVTVGCVIDAAPTQSLSAWLQRCGRALRPQDGYAVILDHAGNITHGLPCEDRQWSLGGRAVMARQSDDEGTITVRNCPECFAIHKPSPSCPECGHVYEIKYREIDEIDGDLQEIDVDQIRRQQREELAKARTKSDLEALAQERGYKPGYADHVERARQEKQMLRDQLFNLSVAAGSMGVPGGFSKRDIYQMKPKALKESIKWLEDKVKSMPQYNKVRV